jgi:Ca-activated chloride channel homolog
MWNDPWGLICRLLPACATLLGALATAAMAQAPLAQGQGPASVIVVFDGSGSMAGTIEGLRSSKVALAKDAVRRGLAKVGPQTRVGLVAFGHRRGDCGDVELMRPLEPLDAQRLGEALDRMNPRGRGPLTTALREAAKSLPPGPGRRSLILIHDDADNCQQNVCVVAEELRRAGITAHVVGLGLKPNDAAAMACLPQVTGGQFQNARTAEQIVASIEDVLRLAGNQGVGVETPSAPSAAAPTPPPTAAAIPANGPPGLYLRVLLAPSTDPVSLPLKWAVYAEGKPETILFAGRAANPYVAVAPGRYVIEGRDGPVFASQTVDVSEKEPTAGNVILNAGTLQVKTQAQKSGAALGDAVVSISDVAQGAEGRKDAAVPPPLAMFRGGEGSTLLPAGRYLVRVEQGLVRAERSVVVPAGSQGRLEVTLDAARLLVSATGQDTAASAEPVLLSVVEDDPDAPKGRREVIRSAARQADFVLAPGTYYVVARQGSAEARERLAVGPGDVVRRSLNLAAGRLALTMKPAGSAAPTPAELVSYRVDRLDGPTPEVITTSRAAPMLVLSGGRYRVEGRYGAMNARTVRDIEVKAGQTQQLTLEPQAAALRLRILANGVPVVTDVLWDVRDETGVTVWTTGQPEPAAVLQAGRYAVRVETREKRYDRAIELRAGESRVVEVATD